MPIDNPVLRLTSPGSLIPAIDYILGFRPADSTVIMLLRGRTVQVTARIDNDELSHEGVVDQMLAAADKVNADLMVAVSYHPSSRHLDAAGTLLRKLYEAGLVIEEHLMVGDENWVSLRQGGTGALADLEHDQAACEMIYHGHSTAASRAEIAARLAPGSEEPSERFNQGLAGATALLEHSPDYDFAAAIAHWTRADELDDYQLGDLAGLAQHPDADVMVLPLITRDNAEKMLDTWSRIVRLTEGRYAVLPLVAAGCAGWASGKGVQVNTAIDQLKELAPKHPAIDLLTAVAHQAMPPSEWDKFAPMFAASSRSGL